jgi:hypothetical protein
MKRGGGGESETLERQKERERERECETGRVAARRGSVSCKNDRRRKWTIWDKKRIKAKGLF